MDGTVESPLLWLPVVKQKDDNERMALLQLLHDCIGREGFPIMDEGEADCVISTEPGG